jgi:demethylmenaquinone methyltransferase/2-methoxy-6-polyprenyl-1,4-benzoquinol methylase
MSKTISSHDSLNPEAGWFGFTRVEAEEKTARVGAVFRSVASRYDLMNDLMSAGLHRLWKDYFVEMIAPRAGETILDVAGGTGDISFRIAERTGGKAKIILCDINPAMMEVGRERAMDRGWTSEISWVAGNAEVLPFAARSVDKLCIAFGLRNVTHIDEALASFARVLKPGGRFFCLEFSSGVSPWLKVFYEKYCEAVLPRLGQIVAADREAYRYLAESIRKFPAQDELARRMARAGLANIRHMNLMGGVAVIHTGWIL